MVHTKKFLFAGILCAALAGCSKVPEMTLEEIAAAQSDGSAELIAQTRSKPYTAAGYKPGKRGGVWYGSISEDPKTFNYLIGERDGNSAAILDQLTSAFADYDTELKQWVPNTCDFEIEVNQEKKILILHYTIKDNVVWSYADNSNVRKATSDDVIFWYDKIEGDPDFQSSGYSGQFVMMEDGSYQRIMIVKKDDRRFDFIFPRIVADPVLHTTTTFKPSWLYKKVYEEKGKMAVKEIFGVDTPLEKIPSLGKWHITEYTPGQRIVFTRNEKYWQKDSNNQVTTYPDQKICQIVADQNTSYLLFKQNKLETYSPPAENLSDVIANQNNDYSVFNGGGSLGAMLWSFNQNPVNKNEPYYYWFTKKQFRQAMSCLLNRDRIINQTYRGLASPKYDIFPDANPFYNPDITLQYRYDLEKAMNLFASIGFKKNDKGVLCDDKGRPIEFDLTIPSGSSSLTDISSIITDECNSAGIKVNVRQTDFQKVVEMLTRTYDWHSVIIGLGANFFPSQGSNVWPSTGNLHLWYPLQKKPATDWEARIDYLYNEGSFTADYEEAKKLWDEYQTILLEECPVIYLVRGWSFFAIKNRWDFSNFTYDNKNGAMTDRIWARESAW
ncbi:MAG: ABC transporter substrate-binding protein [Treponema sp.]|nr:ABC transporter substrate-binding protein [Treponema sp.]